MMKLRIQKMEVGERVATPPRMVTRTDIEHFCSLTGMMSPEFLINPSYVMTGFELSFHLGDRHD